MNTKLILEDLCLPVFLGVALEERSKQQTVLVTIEISFPQPLAACSTDQLSDTICYDSLIKKIEKFCSNKEFNLIESLGAKLFQCIKLELLNGINLKLKIVKQTPMPNLKQSIFEIAD